MKNSIILIGIVMLSKIPAFSQNVSCTQLLDYVESNGRSNGSVSSLSLYDSSWLNKVKAYTIDGNLAVVAKIKKNQYDLYGKNTFSVEYHLQIGMHSIMALMILDFPMVKGFISISW